MKIYQNWRCVCKHYEEHFSSYCERSSDLKFVIRNLQHYQNLKIHIKSFLRSYIDFSVNGVMLFKQWFQQKMIPDRKSCNSRVHVKVADHEQNLQTN